MNLNIVLVEPEIPQNTGNIARTCAAVGARLHLVKPLGFSLDDKYLKRAGLDYWGLLDVHTYENLDAFFNGNRGKPMYPVTTKAEQHYCVPTYPDEVYFLFGRESRGLDEQLLISHRRTAVRIPMISESRSLNLFNAAAVISYEYLRQHDFSGLQTAGELHHHRWD
jgi:tRNA (cytidine/uridine-2'-O-)-methyltransferase